MHMYFSISSKSVTSSCIITFCSLILPTRWRW
jgi:hypothetical protein